MARFDSCARLHAVVSMALIAGFGIPLHAQDSVPPFVSGACQQVDPALMMALDSVTAHPEVPATLKRGTTLPPFPKELMRPGYDAAAMVAFVVDDRGRVVPASVFVMSSTDPILSRWACKIVPDIRFNAAENRGHAVASQTTLPFVVHGPPVKDSASRI